MSDNMHIISDFTSSHAQEEIYVRSLFFLTVHFPVVFPVFFPQNAYKEINRTYLCYRL